MVFLQLDTTSHTGANVQLQPTLLASMAPTLAIALTVSEVLLAPQAAPVAINVPSDTAPFPPASQFAAIRTGTLLCS